MYVYLVRHGQSYGNVHFAPGEPRPRTDPLTELGQIQSKAAASYVASQDIKPELIITSPYTRALDTASIIQKALGIPLKEDERLREYNPGDWDGTHIDEFTERFNRMPPKERYIFRPPNGESWLDEADRVNEVIKEAEGQNQICLVLVTHFDPIRAVVNLLTKRPPASWDVPAEYPAGSVTRLHKNHDGWTVE